MKSEARLTFDIIFYLTELCQHNAHKHLPYSVASLE